MKTSIHSYPAYRIFQIQGSSPLVLFGAQATDIAMWAGIPQRGRLDDSETAGFQREENATRVRELSEFFGNPKNVVQNPLLCATQDDSRVRFTPTDEGGVSGTLTIEVCDFAGLTLKELIDRVVSNLEGRLPSLADQPMSPERLVSLMARVTEIHAVVFDDTDEDESEVSDGADIDADVSGDVASVLLSEETQLIDFYHELKYRSEILSKMPEQDITELLGFSKEAMVGYLQPIVLVDGQHRLRGAVTAAEIRADSSEGRNAQMELINGGLDPQEAETQVVAKNARVLPVSLLLDDSPSEHVFQFVVVNQKATPMGKALLGTIVSTSLSRDELEPVADRLKEAGIRLEDSQAVAYLTRAPESPFRAVVQTGIRGDEKDALGWNVLKGLVAIFRELKGGKVYGQTNDYADIWKKRLLEKSALVEEADDLAGKFASWSRADGPWRAVFVRFFALIRERFGDADPAANNGWGSTTSNLFNMVSLTILAADYFQFLTDTKQTLDSIDDVDSTVSDWLEGVNRTYFARDWKLNGLKKAQRPVQEQWAKVWVEYRKNPERLPRIENYRPSGK